MEERLRGYGELVVPLLNGLKADPGDRSRWVDLGCGKGEFCALLREWGWDAEGVDGSPGAVEACRARGIDVTLADVLDYLETRPDDPVGGMSAIQLIEHLPRRAWVRLFQEIHRALGPGGALLLETINGQNADAVADYFVADVTHTWPGHPETLKLMAEHAGFEQVEVRFVNPDHRGRAQDVAIWAVKAAHVTGPGEREETEPADDEVSRSIGIGAGRERRRGGSTREVYWAGDGVSRSRPTSACSANDWTAYAHQMRVEQRQLVPAGETLLGSSAGWKHGIKLVLWRLTRFSTMRYDRLLARARGDERLSSRERLAETEEELARLREDVEASRAGIAIVRIAVLHPQTAFIARRRRDSTPRRSSRALREAGHEAELVTIAGQVVPGDRARAPDGGVAELRHQPSPTG